MSGSDLPSLRGWPELLAEIARHPHAGGAAAALRLAACHGGQRIWIPNRAAGSRIERDLGPALAAALVDLRGGLFVSVPRFHARLAEERRRVVLTHPGRSANDLAAELGISYRMVQKIRASARPDPRQTSLFQ